MPPSRSSTAGDLGCTLATPPSRAPSSTPKGSRSTEPPHRSASARSRAPSEGRDSGESSGSGRVRRSRAPTPTQGGAVAARNPQPKASPSYFDCGLEQPAFQAVLDWWESAASVLGVTAGTVSQGEVEERLERASGLGHGRASLAEPLEREARLAREAREAARRGDSLGGTPPDAGAGSDRQQRNRPRRSLTDAHEDKERAAPAEDRDGGGIPGLDFVYRLMAPRHLMEQYERLEQEVESPIFKTYSEEEQAETVQLLRETQAAIEQRENRLNIIAAAVGGLHGAYVGTMAAMLAIFVPQRCPPTESQPTEHTCNLYENTHDLSLFNQAVLAVNAITLVMMLLTEISVFRREKWLDTTLSYNPRKAARYLSMPAPDGGPSMLAQHPYIAHQLLWQNLTAGNLARATIGIVLINLLLSSILIVGFYNDGARSSIMIITNTMLLGAKLLWAAIICLQACAVGALCALVFPALTRLPRRVAEQEQPAGRVAVQDDAHQLQHRGRQLPAQRGCAAAGAFCPLFPAHCPVIAQSTRATRTSTRGRRCRRSTRTRRRRRRATSRRWRRRRSTC